MRTIKRFKKKYLQINYFSLFLLKVKELFNLTVMALGLKNTYYMRDANGEVLAIYETMNQPATYNPNLPPLSSWNIYGSESHGLFATKKPDNMTAELTLTTNFTFSDASYKKDLRILGAKEYETKDHLGNVRLTYSDIKVPTNINTGAAPFYLDLKSINNYYSFGMLMQNASLTANPAVPGQSWQSGSHRYGFNGKEMDNEVIGLGNEYDYGMRIFNSKIGRFFSVDPLTQKFPWYSPYQFSGNNPIFCIDLDGLEPVPYYRPMPTTNRAYEVYNNRDSKYMSSDPYCEVRPPTSEELLRTYSGSWNKVDAQNPSPENIYMIGMPHDHFNQTTAITKPSSILTFQIAQLNDQILTLKLEVYSSETKTTDQHGNTTTTSEQIRVEGPDKIKFIQLQKQYEQKSAELIKKEFTVERNSYGLISTPYIPQIIQSTVEKRLGLSPMQQLEGQINNMLKERGINVEKTVLHIQVISDSDPDHY